MKALKLPALAQWRVARARKEVARREQDVAACLSRLQAAERELSRLQAAVDKVDDDVSASLQRPAVSDAVLTHFAGARRVAAARDRGADAARDAGSALEQAQAELRSSRQHLAQQCLRLEALQTIADDLQRDIDRLHAVQAESHEDDDFAASRASRRHAAGRSNAKPGVAGDTGRR